MRQWVVFALAWYGLNTTIWDVLEWIGVIRAKAGWLWRGDFKAGVLDVLVAGAAYYATWYLLKHSLREFVGQEERSSRD